MISLSANDQLHQWMVWALSQTFQTRSLTIQPLKCMQLSMIYLSTMHWELPMYFKRGCLHSNNGRNVLLPWIQKHGLCFKKNCGKSLSCKCDMDAHNHCNWGFPVASVSFATESSIIFLNNLFVIQDENFAREVMQLFTIGVQKLNMNGLLVINTSTGLPIPTYQNSDIQTFAWAWTGFLCQEQRCMLILAVIGSPKNRSYANQSQLERCLSKNGSQRWFYWGCLSSMFRSTRKPMSKKGS